LYYQPKVNEQDLALMRALDEIYTCYPFYGARRMQYELQTSYNLSACREHIQRLMRELGLEAVYPKKHKSLSDPNLYDRKYPYLLRGLRITHPNQVWGTDITYIRLSKGFCYLVALLDWYSRYVVSWTLSQTLEIDFCLENLQRALTGVIPSIHNSDQGSHFTSPKYTRILEAKDIQISMDARGRCFDNIFTERLWRTIKYEHVYLNDYTDVQTARAGLTEYLDFYNTKRPHQSLDYQTPAQAYFHS
jgi:putative transposase